MTTNDREPDNNTDFGLVVAFPDGSPSFVHGFEAGALWELMTTGTVAEIERTTHRENREVISRMAVAEGWSVEFAASEVDGWDYAKLTKDKTAPTHSNPNGLRLVHGGLSP